MLLPINQQVSQQKKTQITLMITDKYIFRRRSWCLKSAALAATRSNDTEYTECTEKRMNPLPLLVFKTSGTNCNAE
jgi:hypothetical protein